MRSPSSSLKARLPVLLLAAALVSRAAAQTTAAEAATSSETTSYGQPLLVIAEPRVVADEVAVGKGKFKLTGLLARPFKAVKLGKAGSALKSLVQAINPFAREPEATEDVRIMGELSTQAWSASVSWRPGDYLSSPVTREAGVSVLSISR